MSFLQGLQDWFAGKPTGPKIEPALQEEEKAKAKIAQAVALIATRKVCEYAAFLFNEFHPATFGQIQYYKKDGAELNAKDFGQKEWLKVAALVGYKYQGRTIEFVAVNMSLLDTDTKYGTFLVRYNQETVLEVSCMESVINEAYMRAYSVHAAENDIKQFKAGGWMHDLSYLVLESKKHSLLMKEEYKKRVSDELKERANKIDLG